MVESAKRDVFERYSPPPPPAPPAPSVIALVQPVQDLPLPPPQAPSINLRFLGTMLTPTGQRLVYLARGDAFLAVAVGDRLDEGYVVTALTRDAVSLTFPPLDTQVVIPISEPSQQ